MATHKSAIKRHLQNKKRGKRNASIKSTIKTAVKKLRKAIEEKDAEKAKTLLGTATILLDKAVSKGVLHRNNASRKISRLTIGVNSL